MFYGKSFIFIYIYIYIYIYVHTWFVKNVTNKLFINPELICLQTVKWFKVLLKVKFATLVEGDYYTDVLGSLLLLFQDGSTLPLI